MKCNFEWDPNKADDNWKKHKVKFENAATVLIDPNALTLYDEAHSKNEDRWITLGFSSTGNLLVTCHTFNQINKDNAVIRIFSSRKATKKENKQYTER